ncbi:MAG: tRNA pseudouridine(38-40) synthase TruA [Ignavibacteriaceae bacterium]|jgi:tRNA pseudouridine38-40 synthase|nr:tRNA pseudouridine(38-40) synthase TruA [Ignavibacteriaceae bacterium]
MNNYKLTIQYEGTNYCGWQSQLNAPSIQSEITAAIKIILKSDINLIGSGRTDTGVHALGQVANFKIENKLDQEKLRYSLNCILPDDISIVKVDETDENFHSRFDAKLRTYLYIISKIKSPFYKNYSYNYPFHKKLSIAELNKLSKELIGEKDFSSFSRKNPDLKNYNCIIKKAYWKENREFIYFVISANRFLHGMVRAITGTLLEINKLGGDCRELSNIISQKDRTKAGESIPAKGLFLYKVEY